jgi:hypothetical protein
MLPIAAQFVCAVTEERARSALPAAPVRRANDTSGQPTVSPRVRRRLATALRRAADRFEPVAE